MFLHVHFQYLANAVLTKDEANITELLYQLRLDLVLYFFYLVISSLSFSIRNLIMVKHRYNMALLPPLTLPTATLQQGLRTETLQLVFSPCCYLLHAQLPQSLLHRDCVPLPTGASTSLVDLPATGLLW